jgi:hypothetical protein
MGADVSSLVNVAAACVSVFGCGAWLAHTIIWRRTVSPASPYDQIGLALSTMTVLFALSWIGGFFFAPAPR